jgi:hypothetical protein
MNVSRVTWEYLINTPAALLLNESMFNSTLAVFPELIEELYGMTSGCNLSFAEVFFLNTMTEIESLQGELIPQGVRTVVGHCTDVFASGEGPSRSVWGHNEDSGAHDCNVTYLVNATIIDSSGAVLERFVAYTYPGSVAGRAFGWNHHGVIITTNALMANNNAFDNPSAIPRAFHNRATYRATSPQNAIELASGIPTITAFSLNVGTWDFDASSRSYRSRSQYINVENDPSGVHSVKHIFPRPEQANWAPSMLKSTPYHFYHANNFEVLQGNATFDVDSGARIDRLNEFPVPTSSYDVRQMLGDTQNSSWPVWQHGCASDLFTMATVVFHFDTQMIHLYAGNPKTSQPVYVFSKL